MCAWPCFWAVDRPPFWPMWAALSLVNLGMGRLLRAGEGEHGDSFGIGHAAQKVVERIQVADLLAAWVATLDHFFAARGDDEEHLGGAIGAVDRRVEVGG